MIILHNRNTWVRLPRHKDIILKLSGLIKNSVHLVIGREYKLHPVFK